MKQKVFWLVIIALDIILVYINQSTFDDGDSILHYLQAHQAWATPHFFLDMWAKPVFVLLAWPFAAVGWWGMKLFNITCVLLSTYITARLFQQNKFEYWWAVPLTLAAPAYFLVQSSGLTEPLFTLFLTAIVFLEYKDKTVLALILLSFLPFVRAEGWVVMLMFATYIFFAKKAKLLPYIALGTVIYSIIGQLVLGDFLFMFHQNPYNGIETKFGHGSIFHYFNQLPYIIGLPIVVLVAIGYFRGFMLLIRNKLSFKELFLVYGMTLGYIVSQSIFWHFGLFHSFGMTRVLIVIIPLLAFIGYRGLEWASGYFSIKRQRAIKLGYLLFILLFPLTNNKMGFKIEKSFRLSDNQLLVEEAANYICSEALLNRPFYCNAYYLPMILEKRVEMKSEFQGLSEIKKWKPTSGSILVWDSYFAVTDAEVTDTYIEQNLKVRQLKRFKNQDSTYNLKIYEVLE